MPRPTLPLREGRNFRERRERKFRGGVWLRSCAVPLPEKFFAALEFFDPPSRGGWVYVWRHINSQHAVLTGGVNRHIGLLVNPPLPFLRTPLAAATVDRSGDIGKAG